MYLEITRDDPVFQVIYLGNQMVEKGEPSESALQTSRNLLKRNGRHCKKISITIGTTGIKVIEKDVFGQNSASYIYPIQDVSYCMANVELSGIFAWLESSSFHGDTRCHAVACDSPQTARAMARRLTENCDVAHNEMVARVRREERQKMLEKRLVTERMRINTNRNKLVHGEAELGTDDEDEWALGRIKPFKGGLVEDSGYEKPTAKAKLKCMRIGSRKYLDAKTAAKDGQMEIESTFSWSCKEISDS